MKNILYAAAEAVPFIKTGGLADVIGSLPLALDPAEYDVRVILPAYTAIPDVFRREMKELCHFYSYFNGRDRYVGVKSLEYRGVRWYFIDNEEYFAGKTPYTDYVYDIEKFCFFCKAVLSVLPSLGFRPDLIHCHDWHTGLIPVYLKNEFSEDPYYRGIRCVMSVHNLKFQGNLLAEEMSAMSGLPLSLFTVDRLRCWKDGNMLKGGLVYSDWITTVSPSYAEEIRTPEYGEGLEGLFQARQDSFSGILNGIDTVLYDPAHDSALSASYDPESFRQGKAAAKAALQRELGLPEDPEVLLLGLVSRLTEQKGLELVAPILPELLKSRIQLVVLGTGEERFEELFRSTQALYPDRAAAEFSYKEELAHRIYAASDAFLMPSRFEPCGLSQLIALRYGSLPVVRETGGLKDTVMPYNRFTGEGWGFSFLDYDPAVLLKTLRYALKTFYEQPEAWSAMTRRAMELDYSWRCSAGKYEALYKDLLEE